MDVDERRALSHRKFAIRATEDREYWLNRTGGIYQRIPARMKLCTNWR